MSCKTSIAYGYGFDFGGLTVENFEKFVINHASTIKESLNESALALLLCAENDKDFTNTFDDLGDHVIECMTTGYESYLAIVSNIMSAETDITFQFEPGQDGGEEHVMLRESMPWDFSEKEINLTNEYLDQILNNYITELKLNSKPQYVAVEYFG